MVQHSRTTATATQPRQCRRHASTRHATVPPPPFPSPPSTAAHVTRACTSLPTPRVRLPFHRHMACRALLLTARTSRPRTSRPLRASRLRAPPGRAPPDRRALSRPCSSWPPRAPPGCRISLSAGAPSFAHAGCPAFIRARPPPTENPLAAGVHLEDDLVGDSREEDVRSKLPLIDSSMVASCRCRRLGRIRAATWHLASSRPGVVLEGRWPAPPPPSSGAVRASGDSSSGSEVGTRGGGGGLTTARGAARVARGEGDAGPSRMYKYNFLSTEASLQYLANFGSCLSICSIQSNMEGLPTY
uniref:Uncharacterized protein n=1 Tax=Setaria italica TaxID=4555 RepID=K3XKH1_SETIT